VREPNGPQPYEAAILQVLYGMELNRFRGCGEGGVTQGNSPYEVPAVQVLSGMRLNGFRGSGGGGVTQKKLTFRGCHCPDYLGWN
jgi:hypothetical protein